MKKRITSIILTLAMLAGIIAVSSVTSFAGEDKPYMTDAGIGARSAIDEEGNVYLGGNYIEIGLSKHGSFGTVPKNPDSVPNNFHTYWFLENTDYAKYDNGYSLGMIADGDGWNKGNDPIAGDFFVPGGPFEEWYFCYKIDLDGDGTCETTRTLQVADLYEQYTAEQWSVEPVTTIVNTGDAETVAAKTVGTTLDGVVITLNYSFGVDDLYYTTEANIQNNSGKKITDAFYGRDFDPDQDQWFTGDYETYNKTMCNPDPTKKGDANNIAMVVARGWKTGAGFFFLSLDNRATAIDDVLGLSGYYGGDCFKSLIEANQSEYTKYDADRDSNNVSELEDLDFLYEDTGIGILCNFGTIEAGASDQFIYFSSLDPDVSRCVNKVICDHTDANHDHICDLCKKTVSDHKGTLVSGVETTRQSAGYKNYYKCDCGKLFEDENCTVEITDLAAWKAEGGAGYIAKLAEEKKVSPETGDNSTVALWISMLALSFTGICTCTVLNKKRKIEK